MLIDFRYRAVDHDGKKVSGFCSAAGTREALDYLYARSLIVIDLKKRDLPEIFWKQIFTGISTVLGIRLYSSRDIMLFCRQFHTLLTAGIPILNACNILAEQIEKQSFRKAVADMAATLEQGNSLAEAIQNQHSFIPKLLANMVAAGEASGSLDQIFAQMADHYEKQHDLEESIRAATAYPLLITGVAISVMLVMVIYVLPQFRVIFNSIGIELPLFSRLLLNSGQYITRYGYKILPVILAAVLGVSLFSKSKTGRPLFDQLRFKLPLYGKIYQQNFSARFARILGMMLKSGINLHEALNLADRIISNSAVSSALGEIRTAISRGDNLAVRMRSSSLFPKLLTAMINIGEETGELVLTLESTARFYEREVSYAAKKIGSILEPVLVLLVGLFIGLVVYSVFTPMYQIFLLI